MRARLWHRGIRTLPSGISGCADDLSGVSALMGSSNPCTPSTSPARQAARAFRATAALPELRFLLAAIPTIQAAFPLEQRSSISPRKRSSVISKNLSSSRTVSRSRKSTLTFGESRSPRLAIASVPPWPRAEKSISWRATPRLANCVFFARVSNALHFRRMEPAWPSNSRTTENGKFAVAVARAESGDWSGICRQRGPQRGRPGRVA